MKVTEQQMNALAGFVGKQVEIEYVNYGRIRRDVGELREISPFHTAVVGGLGAPFVGYGCAVRRIVLAGSREVIYSNPAIPADYDIRSDEELWRAVEESFGAEVANQQKKAKEDLDEKWARRVAELDAAAKAKGPELVESGAALVKPELVEQWREYATKNTDDGYSAAIIEGTIGGLRALAKGKTPKEAEDACTAAETGFQMGCVAKGLSYFAPRGGEFRAYWNRKYVSEDRALKADSTGAVVNPAIFTLDVQSK